MRRSGTEQCDPTYGFQATISAIDLMNTDQTFRRASETCQSSIPSSQISVRDIRWDDRLA